jgi:hypothetical protein
MNYTEKINQLQQGIEILEAMKHFENRIRYTSESMNGVMSYFPELVKKYNHKITIYKMCIERLRQRYLKTLSNGI